MTEKKLPRKKYIIVIGASSHELENLVGDRLLDDYLPLGGVCAYIKTFPGGFHRLRLVQAMMQEGR